MQTNSTDPIDSPPPEFDDRRTGSAAVLRALLHAVLDVVETILPAFVIALLINLFLAQGTYVHGQSMEPNLHENQRLIVEKVSYKLRSPQRGDIVVIQVEGFEIPLIKRVIGLSGEMVQIQDNQVLIDGQPVAESYLSEVMQNDFGPTQVPDGHIFVMGDNRRASNDSRYFGAVPLENIIGRAWVSYWPIEEIGLFD
jgi:signal peptidase I